jgi:predicted phosphohydrolase
MSKICKLWATPTTDALLFLQEYEVDFALWGHFHNYQRTCPVFNSTCTDGGVTHVVIGMGGRELEQNGFRYEIPVTC